MNEKKLLTSIQVELSLKNYFYAHFYRAFQNKLDSLIVFCVYIALILAFSFGDILPNYMIIFATLIFTYLIIGFPITKFLFSKFRFKIKNIIYEFYNDEIIMVMGSYSSGFKLNLVKEIKFLPNLILLNLQSGLLPIPTEESFKVKEILNDTEEFSGLVKE